MRSVDVVLQRWWQSWQTATISHRFRGDALTSQAVPSRPGPAIARAALALAIVILASRTWFLRHRAIDIDEFEHAHAAWCVAGGMVPYRDFFEHHTPLLYLAAAPVFDGAPVDRDAGAALHVLLTFRWAMFSLTLVALAATYVLGSLWSGALTGALAVVLLTTSEQFLNSMLEFRPDVPAVACVLLSLVCAVSIGRRPLRSAVAFAVASGALLSIAVLCTQKAIFAAPGILVAIAQTRRPAAGGAWVAGAMMPAIAVLAWFGAHDAIGDLFFATVTANIRLNADRFATLPRLVRNTGHHPALYLFGFAGLVVALRRRPDAPRVAITATAVSLLAGAFVIGKAYDQYFALLLPVLAVAAAGWMVDALRVPSTWRAGTRAPAWIAALAGAAACFIVIRPLTTASNLTMAACFSASALLAASAFHLWGSPRPTAAAMMGLGALAALLAGNVVREFDGNERQIADLRWVIAATQPSDTALNGYPSVTVFRPHAWFYFFLTGPFPSEEDYARLLASLRAGRIRPRLVVLSGTLTQAPRPVLDYIHAHYRPARGDILERIDP